MTNENNLSLTQTGSADRMQPGRHALVAGWFSFSDGHATAGDVMALEVACNWLSKAGFTFDIAYDDTIGKGIDWQTADPASYSDAVFVCGPFEQKPHEFRFLARFSSCRLSGLNLSMVTPLQQWNPFDILLERDSSEAVQPDMVFESTQKRVPVVGVCLVEDYPAGEVDFVNRQIQQLIDTMEMSVVYIDTQLTVNETHLRTPPEVESLIARMDALITTRLHGSVMAIKNGVPVLAIDPEKGGFKIVKQMQEIGWPVVYTPETLDIKKLELSLRFCLSEEARAKARECFSWAMKRLGEIRSEFEDELHKPFVHDDTRRAQQIGSVMDFYRQPVNASETVEPAARTKGRGWFHYADRLMYWTLPSPFRNFVWKVARKLLFRSSGSA